jgi:hypothetical protein
MTSTAFLTPTALAPEIYIADVTLPLPEMFRRQALQYRQSAAEWQQDARTAIEQKDFHLAIFAANNAHERLQWAEQAEQDMLRALKGGNAKGN